MELASVWRSMADQGIMFWSATGAVALGVTLILSAGIIQVRRLRLRSGRRVSSIPEAKIEAVKKSSDHAKVREKPLECPKTLEVTKHGSEGLDSQDLHHLLARLRSAADRLDKYHLTTCQNSTSQAESPLKECRDGVDYLFRAGTG